MIHDNYVNLKTSIQQGEALFLSLSLSYEDSFLLMLMENLKKYYS